MRRYAIISLLLVLGSACRMRLPHPGEIGISVKATTRIETRVVAPTVAADAVIVPLQDAQVVEFFGVPLEGADDVVFVLDCSGSMADPAIGRIAQYKPTTTPAPAPPPPPGPPPGAPPEPPPPVDPTDPPPPPPEPTPTSTPTLRKIDVAQVELVEALERLKAGTRINVIFFNSDLEAFAPAIVPLEEQGRTQLVAFVRGTQPVGSTALAPAMRTAFLMNAKRIVLLSDGLGNVGGGAHSVLKDAREGIRGGVRIDTIGLGVDQDTGLLSTLARESGGLYQPL